jgi:hypothetical protein
VNVVIARRFRGPPESANGGYACGTVARVLGATSAEITLRSPPPLDTPLGVRTDDAGRVTLHHEGTLVAEGLAAETVVEPPIAVSFADAERAALDYAGFAHHIFPACFVCGPERAPGDGLRIFPALVAAPWMPAEADTSLECVWAALDCPSYFGFFAEGDTPAPRALLGRLTARVDACPVAGERCVLQGWSLGREGRKLHAGSALFSDRRGLLALARATWIQIP